MKTTKFLVKCLQLRIKWKFFNAVLFYKKSLFSVCIVFAAHLTYCQPIDIQLKQFNPVSPASARLMEEVNYPIGYSTGATNLSIPLYVIKTRDFVLPISLSCNTSGLKYRSEPGWVGLGWSLKAEPSITREVRGRRDEDGYLQYNSNFYSGNSEYLRSVNAGNYDVKPDIFYFNTLESSGKFVFKRPENSSESGLYRPIFFPASPEKLQISSIANGIDLKDARGNLYSFGKKSIERETSNDGGASNITTWKASKILSLQKDSINFTYKLSARNGSYAIIDQTVHNDFYAIEDRGDRHINNSNYPGRAWDCGYWRGVDGTMTYHVPNYYYSTGSGYEYDLFLPQSSVPPQYYSIFMPQYYPVYLDSITYSGGKVKFEVSNGFLTQIAIYANNTLIKTISFTYSDLYPNRPLSTRAMSELVITDNLTLQQQKYSFDYYLESEGQAKSVDFWGYYNGSNTGQYIRTPQGYMWSNSDLVPMQQVKINLPAPGLIGQEGMDTIGRGNREPSLIGRMYTLKSITYPTLQKDVFDYELHRYRDIPSLDIKSAGGLRIAKISTYDLTQNSALIKERIFEYGTDGTGHIWSPPKLTTFQQHFEKTLYNDSGEPYDLRRYRIYSSNSIRALTNSFGSAVLYSLVTEKSGLGNSMVKTVYRFHNYPNYSGTDSGVPMFAYDFMDEWKRNFPLGKSFFNANTNEPIFSETSQNMEFGVPELFPGENTTAVAGAYKLDVGKSDFVPNTFYSLHYNIEGNKKVLTTLTKDSLQSLTGYLVNESSFEYGNTRFDIQTGLPAKISKMGSDLSTSISTFKYPYHEEGPVYNSMVSENDILKPVEQNKQIIKGGVVTQNVKSAYNYHGVPSGHLPYSLADVKLSDTKDNSMYTVEKYNLYDLKGNLIEYIRKDGRLVTLLWANDYQLLVAEVVGKNFNSVINVLGQSYASMQQMSSSSLHLALQNLRNQVDALVTSYTYNQSRQIASQTDPAGRTIYYEYDSFNRLKLQKDEQGNILKKYCYNYAGQPVNCN